MSSIGSIYDDPQPQDERGPDLRAEVRVPRRFLGEAGGVRVPLPSALRHAGRDVLRAAQPGDPQDAVTLRLPDAFPDGATLRLRGGGGKGAAGYGDLFLTVRLDDDAPTLALPDSKSYATEDASTSPGLMLGVVVAVVVAVLAVYLLVQ